MREKYRLLLVIFIGIKLLLVSSVTAVSITDSDIAIAFERAEDAAASLQQLEELLPSTGGVIPRGTVSAETRHYGKGGNRFSVAINYNQYLFEQATKDLQKRLGFSNEEVWQDLPNVSLRDKRDDATTRAVITCDMITVGMRGCDGYGPFRTVDGSCNNRQHHFWGMATTCLDHMLPPSYQDGISSPRVSKSGSPLPNPRILSTRIHGGLSKSSKLINLMVMQWGQFLDHDLSLTPMLRTSVNMSMIDCCPVGANDHPWCMPISISSKDAFYGPLNKTCMNFVRSSTCDFNCNLGPRNHVNMLTHFIDGSQIYGSSYDEENRLRSFKNGKLRVQNLENVGDLLPNLSYEEKNLCLLGASRSLCFLAGDERVNEQPGLTSLQTVFLRHHNRIAQILQNLHKDWSDEQVYQTARRIVGAQIQHITYSEFLPAILGGYVDEYELYSGSTGRTIYNPEINPSIMKEFSTAAFRFGHTLVQSLMPVQNGVQTGLLRLTENFFNDYVMFSNEMGPLLSGICSSPSKSDIHVTDALRNHLFEVPGESSGLDLSALNIQRGRDHGLQPYVNYVLECLNMKIISFDDLVELKLMTQANMNKLREIYQHIEDLDLFTAGLSETPQKGALFGPTFACIIGRQFNRLRYGDRFFYEHDNNNGAQFFTNRQLSEIRKTSLAEIICSNSGIKTIKTNVFLAPSLSTPCDKLSNIDVGVF